MRDGLSDEAANKMRISLAPLDLGLSSFMFLIADPAMVPTHNPCVVTNEFAVGNAV